MTFITSFECTTCGKEHQYDLPERVCSDCGSYLEIKYDLDAVGKTINRKTISSRKSGIWRYHELLPVSVPSKAISLGEGGTYLHKCDRLSKHLGLKALYLKDETTNPTGSFIDRGTAVEVTVAKERGFQSLCCGSTGNLAASLVAYAARAGFESKVFIAQTRNVDIGKFYQILAYGANVEVVKNHEMAMERAQIESRQSYYVKAYSSIFLEGVKTTIFEICEQLNWHAPDWLIVPMGNGGHLSMIWKGLRELQKIGVLDEIDTRLVGVQSTSCAPIVDAFMRGADRITPTSDGATIALDIGMGNPSCGHTALRAIRESNGFAISVSDKDTLDAVSSIARREGVFVEPASATPVAALRQLLRSDRIHPTDTIVCVVTGMGLKYPEIARILVKGKSKLEHLLSRVEDRKFTTQIGRTKQQILQILVDSESYGYGIWRTLVDDFGISIKIPSVYQHLSELRSTGLVSQTRIETTFDNRKRAYYGLTERGQRIIKQLTKLA
ncbi:MAG: threonine synthase [Candidatus Thorarchaeota archaeon]